MKARERRRWALGAGAAFLVAFVWGFAVGADDEPAVGHHPPSLW